MLQLPLLLPFVPGLMCIGRRQLPVLLLPLQWSLLLVAGMMRSGRNSPVGDALVHDHSVFGVIAVEDDVRIPPSGWSGRTAGLDCCC